MSTSWSEHDDDLASGRHTGSDPVVANHEQWDELAVGYALTALEPDELDRFFDHLVEACPHCRQLVDDTAAIGAQIGSAMTGPVEEIPSGLRDRVLEAALEARPAVPQSSADIPAPTGPPVPLRQPAPSARVVDLAERRDRRTVPARAGWLVAAAAAVVALVLSVTTLTALHGQSEQRAAASARLSALNAITVGGPARVVALDDNLGDDIATVVARPDSISVLAQTMKANPASSSYVLWGIKTMGSDPIALGVFDVRGDKVQATQVAADSRGQYTEFTTYAVSQEPGHTPPAKPSTILARSSA